MSIVLVVFPGAPRPCPDALKAEQDLEANIERRIKGCFSFIPSQT